MKWNLVLALAVVSEVSLGSNLSDLGKFFFFEKRLSKGGTVACASCHDLSRAGTDGLKVPVGVGGALGLRNSPGIFNLTENLFYFWDGRARNLEEQARGPILNPSEMGWPTVKAFEKSILVYPDILDQYESVFGDRRLNINNVATAIAVFERSLKARNAPYDRFLSGQHSAISESARRGSEAFTRIGCIGCHNGINFGGEETAFFPRTYGLPASQVFIEKYRLMDDQGLKTSTGQAQHAHIWKVPSLRNVEVTSPYFHNGTVDSLEEAVLVMAQVQLGASLSDGDRIDLVAFLKSLTDDRFQP